MTAAPVCPAYALAHVAPEFLDSLSEVERFVFPHLTDVWLRPEQHFPAHNWRSLGYICGRGWGKTHAIACPLNAEIERGEISSLALMAPTERRVEEVQIAALIECAPPWFKPEPYAGSIRWPNGLVAQIFTPEAPGRPRGGDFNFAWLSELLDWAPAGRVEAFNNITTATRKGFHSRFAWDTTCRGTNENIDALLAAHKRDPRTNVVIRGQMFDNPLLSPTYIESECRKYTGQEYFEEILGEVFRQSAGALWDQGLINSLRRAMPPSNPELVVVAVDPATSTYVGSDETGIVKGCRGRDGHVYVTHDDTGHYMPDEWGKIVVEHCMLDAAGVVLERNRLGDNAITAIQSEARTRSVDVVKLKIDEPMPPRRPGTIYVREVIAANSKGTRATGPAAETRAGRVHICGVLAKLERQLTTFVPGVEGQRSPNQYDAHAYVVTELAGLEHDRPTRRAKQDARAAMAAHERLVSALVAAGSGRGIGL